MYRGRSFSLLAIVAAGAVGIALGVTQPAAAQSLPEIRTHARNQVPACVTPQRLMQFLKAQNSRLLPKFDNIADWYKKHGEANRVRWDYAFFQMLLETNYLKFKNAAGQGDVDPKQNNFAGIGTTGGGVPGDAFPDVSTGVLGQMQHLMAYSGERVDNPVGRRTREKQDEIIQRSKMLGRSVTFKDLTRRWAVDPRYGSSIAHVAGRFTAEFCNGREPADEETETPTASAGDAADEVPGRRGKARTRSRAGEENHDRRSQGADAGPVSPDGRQLAREAIERERDNNDDRSIRASLGVPALVQAPTVARRPLACRVFTASYGGQKNVLIRAIVEGEYHYTALQVLDGEEERLAQSFITNHARGGDKIGDFASRDEALTRAFDLCPTADAKGDAALDPTRQQPIKN